MDIYIDLFLPQKALYFLEAEAGHPRAVENEWRQLHFKHKYIYI